MDKSVTDFNVRLRTIRLRELIVAIIVAIIISGLIMVPFPELYEDDNLLFIVLLSLVLLFFAWCLRGTHGLDQNVRNLF
jgi:flagellar biosynthesis component FlhA